MTGDAPAVTPRACHRFARARSYAVMNSYREITSLVTGGTDGIGKAIAQKLAAMGHRTIIVGRDGTKGHLAARELRASTSNEQVEFICADLSLIRNVDALAATIRERCKTLNTLILNAGVIHGTCELTSEGLERMFATNFLGRFELARALLPLLEVTGGRDNPSHLLLVSGAARGGQIDYADPGLQTRFSVFRAVRQFCLANDLFALSLAQRIHESSASGRMSVTCLKLGVVKTNIRRQFPRWMKWIVPLVMDPLLGQTPECAAEAAFRALRESSPNDPTAVLFTKIRRLKRLRSDEQLLDREEWTRLWRWADQLAKASRAPGHIEARDTERGLSGFATT
jgi:NAD(P)-dependent dehydrogenase (short-subunit alcohol dehydrogenase family)